MSKNNGQQGTGSIFSRRKLKRLRAKGGGKKMKIRKVYFSVTDVENGRQHLPGTLPQRFCGAPRTKKERFDGAK